MPVPGPRGPLSDLLLSIVRVRADSSDPARTAELVPAAAALVAAYVDDPTGIVYDEDAQLALTVLYELHLQGIVGVSDEWEWHTDLLAARATLEKTFAAAVRMIARPPSPEDGVVDTLWRMTAPSPGPGFSEFMATDATTEQYRELLIHRSLNQLREADVHTLGIPRLAGAPKAALVEVQADEYGGGRPERMHSTLFASTMRELGLSGDYAQYVDSVPAVTLASLNVLSMFGVHRSRLGALVGHLGAVETTSALPCKKYAAGLRRLGYGKNATRFFDEHVEADSMHEQIVCRDLVGGLVEAHPELSDDVLLGAAACLAFDDLIAGHMSGCWHSGTSSLRKSMGQLT